MIRTRVMPPTVLRIPADRRLPSLAALFDSRLFPQFAALLLPPESQVVSCRPWYVRYKPLTNAIAVHELQVSGSPTSLLVHGKCYTAEDFPAARDKAASGHWSDAALGQPHVAVPQHRLLLFAFPNDQVLDGLRFAANPKRIQRSLYAHVDEYPAESWRISDSRLTITPVRFKPEKRAVLRVDTRVRHRQSGEKHPLRVYLRVHGKEEGVAAAALMQRLHDNFSSHPTVRTPRPLAYLAEPQITMVADAGGEGVPFDIAGARIAGSALAQLHAVPAAGAHLRDSRDILSDVASTVNAVAELAPELTSAVNGLLTTLRERAGRDADLEQGLVHGDFHPGQLLARDGHTVLLDFDRSYLGDPAADLGNYAAHTIYRSLVGGRDPRPLVEALIAAHGEAGGRVVHPRRVAFWTGLCLLQLAPTPFRVLDPRWPEIMAATVATCRKELS